MKAKRKAAVVRGTICHEFRNLFADEASYQEWVRRELAAKRRRRE